MIHMRSTASIPNLRKPVFLRRLNCAVAACVGVLLCAAPCFAQSALPQSNSRQQAVQFEQQGNFAQAETAWRSYLKAHPSSAEAYAHLGLLEARQQHYADAIPLYRKALALGSTNPGLHLDLGLALFKNSDTRQALAEFKAALKRMPANSPDRQRLAILVGMCHYGLGEYREAAPYLSEASAHDPGNLTLLLALAHSYLWSKQYQQVLDTYQRILKLNADSAEADVLAGEAMDEMKNHAGAIEQFRAAAKADPHMPNVHFGLGYLLWTQSQIPEAAEAFQAELDNNSNHPQALAYLGDCNLVLNHPELARPLLEKAIKENPDVALAHLDLGIIYSDAGRQDDALRELTTAAKLDPNDVNTHMRLGRVYRALGNKEEAKAEFDKARNITQAADTAVVDKMNKLNSTPSEWPSTAWPAPPSQ